MAWPRVDSLWGPLPRCARVSVPPGVADRVHARARAASLAQWWARAWSRRPRPAVGGRGQRCGTRSLAGPSNERRCNVACQKPLSSVHRRSRSTKGVLPAGVAGIATSMRIILAKSNHRRPHTCRWMQSARLQHNCSNMILGSALKRLCLPISMQCGRNSVLVLVASGRNRAKPSKARPRIGRTCWADTPETFPGGVFESFRSALRPAQRKSI